MGQSGGAERCELNLEDLRSNGVWSPGRERCNLRRRFHAKARVCRIDVAQRIATRKWRDGDETSAEEEPRT
jgi:hypothetical protein